MKFLPLYVWAAVALLMFTQCKKDDVIVDPVVTPAPSYKPIISMDNLGPTITTTKFSWDANNHLTQILYHTGMKSTYTFNNNTADIHLYTNDADYHFDGTGTLNANGAFTKITGTLYDNGVNVPYTLECEYDAKGQITKSTAKEGSKTEVFVFTWTDGNITGLDEYREGVLSFKSVYTYDTAKVNKSGFDVWINFLESTGGCSGVHSKNLLTHSKRTQLSTNTLVSDASFTYTFDSEDYVTKVVYEDAVYNSHNETRYNY